MADTKSKPDGVRVHNGTDDRIVIGGASIGAGRNGLVPPRAWDRFKVSPGGKRMVADKAVTLAPDGKLKSKADTKSKADGNA